MTTWGYYYDGGSVQGESDDLWSLLGEAVPEAACDGDLGRLLVGEMCDLTVGELLDEEDIVWMSESLTPQHIAELVSERCGERIYDGCAGLTCSDADAKASLREVLSLYADLEMAAPYVVAWARDNIELDPSTYCDGRYSLPIDHVDGKWRFGMDDEDEPDAVIVYATTESPETGHVGWCWWALGKMGEAKTLREAMAASEAAMLRVERGATPLVEGGVRLERTP